MWARLPGSDTTLGYSSQVSLGVGLGPNRGFVRFFVPVPSFKVGCVSTLMAGILGRCDLATNKRPPVCGFVVEDASSLPWVSVVKTLFL